MSEYKNGVNAFGNMSVEGNDRMPDIQTGRAVWADTNRMQSDEKYAARVNKYVREGFHLVTEDEGGSGDSDFSIAEVTFMNDGDGPYEIPHFAQIFDSGTIVKSASSYPCITYLDVFVDTNTPVTVFVPLYKGMYEYFTAYEALNTELYDIVTTGGVSYANNYITITGDGTFTAHGNGGASA